MSDVKRILYCSLGALLLIVGISIWGGSQPVAASPAIQEEAQEAQSEQSVWDVIKANEQLSEFETLAKAAVLADNLDQDGPFTIFAPTNAALDAV